MIMFKSSMGTGYRIRGPDAIEIGLHATNSPRRKRNIVSAGYDHDDGHRGIRSEGAIASEKNIYARRY